MQEYAQFLVFFFTWRKAILACSSAFSTSHWDLSISNLKQLKNMYFRLCTLIKLKKKSSPKIFLRFSNKLYKLQLRLIISLGGGKGGGWTIPGPFMLDEVEDAGDAVLSQHIVLVLLVQSTTNKWTQWKYDPDCLPKQSVFPCCLTTFI